MPTALNLKTPTRNKVPCGAFATDRLLCVEDTPHLKYTEKRCDFYTKTPKSPRFSLASTR